MAQEDRTQEGDPGAANLAREMASSPHLHGLLTDSLEVVLDHLLRNNLVRDMPAIGTAVNLVKLGVDLKNRLFLAKLLRFCNNLESVPEKEKRRFISQLQADARLRSRVGEHLVLLLDRFDDVEQKPELLARIFEAYVTGTIDHAAFQKLSTALDRIKVYSLPGLLSFYDDAPGTEMPDDDTLQDLVLCGLASMISGVGLVFGDGSSKNVYRNELGRLFIDIALKDNA